MTMNNLDAMVNSHIIAKSRHKGDEYRVILIGDSSVWGFLQKPEETLAGILNETVDYACQNRPVKFYNLGYPSLSVLKDLMFIDKAIEFDPDLIVWLITLESLPITTQMDTPLVENNPVFTNYIIRKYSLSFPEIETRFWDFTIIGQRRNLADIFRHQIYGVLWSATGVDQVYPEDYPPAQRDFDLDESYKDFREKRMTSEGLAIDVIKNAIRQVQAEFILINEPVLISKGQNSHIRYNFYYPRWAYDQYREIINNEFNESSIKYFDLWDSVPETEFTNSAIHLNSFGQKILADQVRQILENHCQN